MNLSKISRQTIYDIPKQLQDLEFCQGVALNLNQAKPAPKQLNLNKLSNAGGFQSQWLTTKSKT